MEVNLLQVKNTFENKQLLQKFDFLNFIAVTSFFLYFTRFFEMKISSLYVIGVCLACCLMTLFREKKAYKFSIAVCAFLILCCDIIMYDKFISGFFSVTNSVMAKISDRNHEIFSTINTSSNSPYLFITTLIFTFFALQILVNKKIILVTFCAAMFINQLYFDSQVNIVFYICVTTSVLYLFTPKKDANKAKYSLFGIAIIIVCFALFYMNFNAAATENNISVKCHNVLSEFYENIVYGKEKIEIEVVLADPKPMYLREYIDDDTENVSEYSDSFYWLYKSDFYPQTQAKYLDFLPQMGTSNKITVNVKSGNFGNVLTPYGVADYENISINKKSIGGNYFENDGSNVYAFMSYSDYILKPNEIKKALSNSLQSTEINYYLRLEQEYRRFCYDKYLSINDNERNVLKSYLNASNFDTTSQKMATVLEIISQNCSPENDSKTIENNLASSMLETSCKGTEQDYAKLAVEMLRYYQIPARYCEGYILSQEQIGDSGANSAFTLSDDNFHAWAEYYCDGIGWLPFETYPDYLDFCKADNSYIISENTNSNSNEKAENNIENVEEAEEISTIEESADENSFDKYVALFVIVLMSLLLAILIYIFVRFNVKKRAAKCLKTGDKCTFYHRKAVKLLEKIYNISYDYPENFEMLIAKNIDEKMLDLYKKSEMVFGKSLYSNEQIVEVELNYTLEFYQYSEDKFAEKIPLSKRLIYKYIHNLY